MIPKGSILICPHCHTNLAKLAVDLVPGSYIHVSTFEEQAPGLVAGMRIDTCWRCHRRIADSWKGWTEAFKLPSLQEVRFAG